MGDRRVEGEAEGDEREQRLGDQEQAAAVDGVCDRPARDRERQQREELAEREQADLERRVGQAEIGRASCRERV